MAKDWAAVAQAINDRLKELDITQQELASRSGVSPATLRELQGNKSARKRHPRLLAAVSEGLGWPPDHLSVILEGATSGDAEAADPVLTELYAIRAELAELRERVLRQGETTDTMKSTLDELTHRFDDAQASEEKPTERR